VRIALPKDGAVVPLLRPGLSVTVIVDTSGRNGAEAAAGIVGAAEARPAASDKSAAP
jgi:hypothetical protein